MPDDVETPAVEVRKPKRRPASALLLVLFLLVGILIGRYVIPALEESAQPVSFVSLDESGERQLVFNTFWEAWDRIHEAYNGEIDDRALFYGAVRGFVAALGDPYTAFSPPAETKQFEETLNGAFSGVGIEIGVRGGVLTVIAPLEGSPADQAGVREGDIIVAVNDTALTNDMTLDQIVQMIRGKRGTTVELRVVHPGDSAPTDIEIVRDTIEIESVKVSFDDGIALVEITNFNSDTAKRFNDAAREIVSSGARGLIIDVRNNPGGFLDSAVDISSRFVAQGEVVVTERGQKNTEYTAEGDTSLANVPTVVLINQGSASASEILAGALHDHLDVPLIGTQSFGKGSVQQFEKLSDGSSLRITIARWFTPNGRNIDEEGIAPTIEVEQDFETEDVDEVLERAREEIDRISGSQ